MEPKEALYQVPYGPPFAFQPPYAITSLRGAKGGVCLAELIAELKQVGIVSDAVEARQFGARDS